MEAWPGRLATVPNCKVVKRAATRDVGVEHTNLGLGSPDAAALIVRLVRRWTKDMATPKLEKDADVVLPIDLENALWQSLPFHMPGSS